LHQRLDKLEHNVEILAVSKLASPVEKDYGKLLRFSGEDKARDLIRTVIFRRTIGDTVGSLWSMLGYAYDLTEIPSTEQSKIREKMGNYYSELKNKLKNAIHALRETMDNDERQILCDADDQHKKFILLLREANMEHIKEEFYFAPVTQAEVDTVWAFCDTGDVKANVAMELITSVLCAVEDEEFKKIFKDQKKMFFKKFDPLLITQQVAELHITKFVLTNTPFCKILLAKEDDTQSKKRKNEDIGACEEKKQRTEEI